MSLVLKNVCKSFCGKKIISDVSFNVHSNEILMLLGSSGTGKTTLLHIISGLQQMDSGKIFLNNQDIATVPVYKRGIGLLFQESALLPHLTIENNLRFVTKVKKLSKKQQDFAIDKVIEQLQLQNLRFRYPQTLSGGETQKAALARVLIRKPSLLLLDEPFAHLDVQVQYTLRREVKKICRELQVPIVYVTHNQKEALATGDKLAILLNGHLQQLDKPENVYNKPKTPEVATFLGDPPMNIIPAKIQNNKLLICDHKIALSQNTQDKKVLVAIHPQHIYISDKGIKGIVRDIEFNGLGFLFYIEVGVQQFIVFCRKKLIAKEEKVFIEFATDKAIIF
ncbi:ABC transporter ATP-binding protein [Candidatus Uabimicrobium sp. HlEnr_7]|uniref:ABC transporter ATP-binding protein n=1 Tax=Candidatus Uabimicrobium helgolandensis TaxID=3095367 RepID=UPI0035579ACA